VLPAPDAVWVLTRAEDHSQTIVRLNPLSLAVETRTPIQMGTVTSLAAMEGALWAGVDMGADSRAPYALLRIDSRSGEISASLPAQGRVTQLAFDGQFLWALEWLPGNTFFEKTDPQTLTQQTIPPAVLSLDYVHSFTQFAWNVYGLWALSSSRSARLLYRIDPADGRVSQIIPLGDAPDDLPVTLAADATTVWVALHSGKILRVNAESAALSGEIDLEAEIGEVFLQNGNVWAFNRPQAVLYHLDLAANSRGVLVSSGRKMPPTAVPGPTQIPGQVCEGSYPSHLHAGLGAMVNPEPPLPNRVRVEPNKNSKLLGEINPGEKVRVTEGPVCTEGWVWWKIDAQNGNLIGWTAEGDGQDYWLIPLDQ
jgi:hypothetical protein